MFITKTVILCLTILGLFLNIPTQREIKPKNLAISETKSEFQYIHQPLWVKSIVTFSACGLIGLEVWWFLLSKPKSQKLRKEI
jgi:hypothetical protein